MKTELDNIVSRAEARWGKLSDKSVDVKPVYDDLDKIDKMIVLDRYTGTNTITNDTVLKLTKELRQLRQQAESVASEMRAVNNLISSLHAFGVVQLVEQKYKAFDNSAPPALISDQIQVIEKILVQRR